MSGTLVRLKKKMYFRVAAYFGYFAKKVLKKWNPRIIVVTGSSGKTTTLNMLEAQLGDKAIFSHNANSAVGIPFHILGMQGIQESRWEWIGKFIKAPLQSKRVMHKADIYVVEADADRPGEGRFLAELLKPMVTVWVSSSRTHSMTFEALVGEGGFKSLEQAIAHEFAYFGDHTQKLLITDGDNPDIKAALQGKPVEVKYIYHKEAIEDYRISEGESMVTIAGKHTYIFSQP